MPASIEEIDHVKIEENANGKKLIIKSYGLPYMFWGYFLILMALEIAMYLSISSFIFKLLESENSLDLLLAYGCLATMLLIPLFSISMLFFQKNIIREENKLTIEFRIFWIKVRQKVFRFDNNQDKLEVTHLLESPNMAKIQKNPNTRAFENQGHYILTLWSNSKPHFIDRHTRKQDLTKLANLITKF